jgi:hypothetical protein
MFIESNAIFSFCIVYFSLQSRDTQKDPAMTRENVPYVSKPYQASKPRVVPCAKLNEVSVNSNPDIKSSASKETAGVANNTDAKKEAQKQDDR